MNTPDKPLNGDQHKPLAAWRAEAQALLARYHLRFADEQGRHAQLSAQLASGEDLFVRHNLRGHVTCSGLVLNAAGTQVLLVHHKVLGLWLPPGGHFEPPGGLWASALREVAEETGLTAVQPHPWTRAHGGLPIDVDTHAIPPNPAKAEGAHWHHDFRFLLVADDVAPLRSQLDEVHAAAWQPVAQLGASPDPVLQALQAKLQRLGLVAV